MKELHLSAEGTDKKLTSLFRFVYNEFQYYRNLFDQNNIDLSENPYKILNILPVMKEEDYQTLTKEVFQRLYGTKILILDKTSGTTGLRKIRFSTRHDEEAERKLCVRFFRQCGISPTDKVVALDIDSSDIYLFYASALRNLGVKDFIFLTLSENFSQTVKAVLTYDPTLILTVPSVISRCYSELKKQTERKSISLEKIIYIGETMNKELRKRLESELGLELFSFFGSTEIGSMAGECKQHAGIHLYNDSVIPTVLNPQHKGNKIYGEVVWTTLSFRDHPLIKYPTNDFVSIDKERCHCSSPYPLMKKVTRTNEQFVVYGHKFSYASFYEHLSETLPSLEFLQIQIHPGNTKDKVILILPDSLKKEKRRIVKEIANIDEMSYFKQMGHVEFDVKFAREPLVYGRKLHSVVDYRVKHSQLQNP